VVGILRWLRENGVELRASASHAGHYGVGARVRCARKGGGGAARAGQGPSLANHACQCAVQHCASMPTTREDLPPFSLAPTGGETESEADGVASAVAA